MTQEPSKESEAARLKNENRANQQVDAPATGSDAYKCARLEKAILKHDDAYSSRFFRNLAPDIQEFLLSEAQLHQTELPVLGFIEDSETWLLATSQKVVWSRPGFKHQLRYEQIRDMGQSDIDKLGPAPDAIEHYKEWSKQIALLKSTSPWFFFIDDEGNRYEALVPPGGPLYAIWNTMRFMVQLAQIHPINK